MGGRASMVDVCVVVCSVDGGRERYERSHAEYVQFVDDKRRQPLLSYNEQQIHNYCRYCTTVILQHSTLYTVYSARYTVYI